jgi:serine/threonine-protein kinase
LSELIDRLQRHLGSAFRLERELGGGGMSRVFLAEESALGRRVVMKVLPPELAAGVNADRFRREIQLAANLQHPHIVPIFSAGEADGLLYYTMPLIEGESLRHRLMRETELPVAEVLRILREVADALASAHRRGIVHRDIKPDNVLLSQHHAVVTDFGVAKALSSATGAAPAVSAGHPLTTVGLALGTPSYMAPEQAAGDANTDHRADIYALGAMAYEMLTGQPPFTGTSPQQILAAHLSKTPEALATRRATVPPMLADIVMRCLEKRPADRWQSAGELGAALEACAVPSGGSTPVTTAAISRVTRRRWPLVGAAALVAAAAAAIGIYRRGHAEGAVDRNVLAVAPFDVFDPRLQLWREGLVDILSRNFDGAGSIRSVPPSMVIQRWSGRADAPSASRLGHATGAGLVLFGSLVGSGKDSVRVAATLFDLTTGKAVAQVERRDLADRMDRAADSLTVALIAQYSGGSSAGAVRLARLGTSNLGATKAFLQGEQLYRRAVFDSARAAYGVALAQDSGFALAWQRLAQSIGWQTGSGDSIAERAAQRAGTLNHGLGPRDSLMISADSIVAALSGDPGVHQWGLRKGLFDRLTAAVQRYPEDAYAWYELGDARYHWGQGPGLAVTPQQVLDAFDRSIALDSSFVPSYIHPIQLALDLKGEAEARRYLRAYLARHPADRAYQTVDRILAAPGNRAAALATIDSLPLIEARSIVGVFFNSPDTEDVQLHIVRRGLEILRAQGSRDTLFAHGFLAMVLSARGRLGEAISEQSTLAPPFAPPPELTGAIALVGGLAPDSAARLFQRWLSQGTLREVYSPLAWWAARQDTTSLKAAAQRAQTFDRAGQDPEARLFSGYVTAAARAYLSLARRDSAAAITQFAALPDSLCVRCQLERLTRAQLLEGRGQLEEADRLLSLYSTGFDSPLKALWRLEHARVEEKLGKKEAAIRHYQYVTGIWHRADPALQPYVAEAKAALRRLTEEGAR